MSGPGILDTNCFDANKICLRDEVMKILNRWAVSDHTWRTFMSTKHYIKITHDANQGLLDIWEILPKVTLIDIAIFSVYKNQDINRGLDGNKLFRVLNDYQISGKVRAKKNPNIRMRVLLFILQKECEV